MRVVAIVVSSVVGAVGLAYLVGLALPVAHVAAVTRHLAQPSDEVYRRVATVEDYPRWWPDIQRIEILARAPDGRPTFRQHASDGTIVMEVVEQQPPRRFVTRIADPEQPFGGTWTFDLVPQGATTQLTITERGEVYNPLFRFMSRFVFGHTGTIESFLAALEAS